MYAEAGLTFSDFHHFYSQEVNQLEGFSHSHRSSVPMGNLVQTSTISEYDLGAEGDLFKAPEPIIGEPVLSLDPIAAAISMISCGEDVISPQTLNVADIESIQNEQLLSDLFYECKKDLLAQKAIETSFSDVLDIKTPVIGTGENPNAGDPNAREDLFAEGYFHKSASSGCLGSMELRHEVPMGPNFLDFPGMDLGAVYGMRRAFSEGDMKTLGNGDVSLVHSPVGLPQSCNSCTSEDRWQKLSRYRNKRTKRNFGRKIKYACRKALADNQPRVRGRFAKTEESDCLKKLNSR